MRSRQSGVTLIEMIIVVALVGLIAAISFPSVTAGLESLRLTSASDSIVSFLNSGLNRAERRQEAVEITISKAENALTLRSVDPSFIKKLEMPDGVKISGLLPQHPSLGAEETSRSYLLYPGGTIPRLGVEIVNTKGSKRIVRVDPITGVPQVER